MARVTISLSCYQCGGARVLYRSLLGEHRASDFSTAERIQLVTSNALSSVDCPVCDGRGVVDVLARE